jgi:hypothetical protein
MIMGICIAKQEAVGNDYPVNPGLYGDRLCELKIFFNFSTAIENAFNQNIICGSDECDRYSSLKADYAQSGDQIIAPASSYGESGQSVAKFDNPGNIPVGPVFVRMIGDISVQSVNLAFGERREKNARHAAYRNRPPETVRRALMR